MDLKIIVGKNVRAMRTKMGMTQEEFADYAELHRAYIGSVERGEYNLTLETITKLAKALKVDAHKLLFDNSHESKK